ncbi:uncharacterized [Tachysurus ichikawai]
MTAGGTATTGSSMDEATATGSVAGGSVTADIASICRDTNHIAKALNPKLHDQLELIHTSVQYHEHLSPKRHHIGTFNFRYFASHLFFPNTRDQFSITGKERRSV